MHNPAAHLFSPICGAGAELTALLRVHILTAAEILAAAKAGDDVALDRATDAWYTNADDIAAFLSRANPRHWPFADMQAMMRDHLDLTLAEDGSPTRVLDNPAMASLNGHHARFAERRGEVVRYRTDVSVWTGVPERPTDADWDDVAALLGSGAVLGVRPTAALPDGWTTVESAGGVQMTGEAITGAPDPEAVELTPDDVPEVLELIARTRPGPFLPRTIELGRYLGIRRDGRLVAMAGERLHPPGWTEISAVCTDDAFRGQGLGRRLVLAVAHGIRERGETPLLHAAAGNTNAIRLYEHLGFRLRDRGASTFVRVP